MIWQNFRMAISSLGHAKLRSFLTMLGMIIGIGSVVAVLAIGEGVKREISNQVIEIGTNLINISPGSPEAGIDFAALTNSPLTEQDLRSIQQIETVEAATAIMLISGNPMAGETEAAGSTVIAVTPEYSQVINHNVETGRFLGAEYDMAEVVIGSQTAVDLFQDTNPVGQTINIRQRNFTITGVLETFETGFNFGGFDYNQVAYIHLDVAKELTDGNVNLNEINARAVSAETVDETAEEIEAVILSNHGGVRDFTVIRQEDAVELFDSIFGLVTSFIAAIAAISLLVGGIGIMNIMLVSVTERTREIGIRKAIGANNYHILSQFLIEAIVLSLLGGLLGVGFAYLLGAVVQAQTGISPLVTSGAVGLAVGVSAAIGIVFGLAPAVKAARKNPIEALRYE